MPIPIRTLLTVALLIALCPRVSAQIDLSPPATEEGLADVDWKGILGDSFRLLILEHSVRIGAQDKTRAELGGPFWKDYHRSVKMPQSWGDGDGWLVNYVGHPGHGAAAGFIWLHRDRRAPSHLTSFDRRYLSTRLRATAWSAVYSVQFELGPFSEASIGNVGRDPATTGWVDYVVTPLGAFGVMLAEDAMDKYVLAPLERRLPDPVSRAILRSVLNPSRSMAHLSSGRAPWHRSTRRLSGPAD